MFIPNYENIVMAASNVSAKRLPLYEHHIDIAFMEIALGKQFASLALGDYEDKKEYCRIVCDFFKSYGYDTVSFERCIGSVMPGSGALGNHAEGVIKSMYDLEHYPWAEIPNYFFEQYRELFCALREVMPEGMKAIGGPGNGIFECVQDITGYENLCYMQIDEPELYEGLFNKVGETNLRIWQQFLQEFEDIYCVCRFGDDLGFKNNTLLSAQDIKSLIIPQYKRIIDVVHNYNKRFLLHSCGCIFSVMDDLLAAGIDAKHSNEDQIAPFSKWVQDYGNKIGNFGGIDTDAVCRLDKPQMKEYITNVLRESEGHGGIAFGSGNSIPAYVPVENFIAMNEIVREYRKETK